MKKANLQRYVGRIVRLNNEIFQEIKRRAQRHGLALDNSFLVAEVRQQFKQLICYGSSYRVVVSPADVALV